MTKKKTKPILDSAEELQIILEAIGQIREFGKANKTGAFGLLATWRTALETAIEAVDEARRHLKRF